MGLLKFLPSERRRRANFRYYLNSIFGRLEQQGLVRRHRRGGRNWIGLTSAGRQRLIEYQLKDYQLPRPRRWDGKWRIIIFDIWESRREIRDKLRERLERMGLVRLQNSVWVSPCDCEEVVALIKTVFRLGGAVLYIKAEYLENDRWLRRKFDLPL